MIGLKQDLINLLKDTKKDLVYLWYCIFWEELIPKVACYDMINSIAKHHAGTIKFSDFSYQILENYSFLDRMCLDKIQTYLLETVDVVNVYYNLTIEEAMEMYKESINSGY
jgi:hypothetical protein